jgi:hypothetical protein
LNQTLILRSAREIQLDKCGDVPVLLAEQTEAALVRPAAAAERDELVARSQALEQVVGAKSQEVAVSLLGEINRWLGDVEKERKAVKDPFFQFGKKIDKAAADFIATLELEKTRLKKLLSDFQAEQERKAREEQERQEAELRRIAEEEAALRQQQATGQIDAQAVEQRQTALNQEAAAALAIVEPVRADGMMVKKVRKFRVLDIHALYKARPELVSLEPKTATINAVIRATESIVPIPGLDIFEEHDVNARAR